MSRRAKWGVAAALVVTLAAVLFVGFHSRHELGIEPDWPHVAEDDPSVVLLGPPRENQGQSGVAYDRAILDLTGVTEVVIPENLTPAPKGGLPRLLEIAVRKDGPVGRLEVRVAKKLLADSLWHGPLDIRDERKKIQVHAARDGGVLTVDVDRGWEDGRHPGGLYVDVTYVVPPNTVVHQEFIPWRHELKNRQIVPQEPISQR